MAIIRSIFQELDSPFVSKLKAMDRKRAERMIAAFNAKLITKTKKAVARTTAHN